MSSVKLNVLKNHVYIYKRQTAIPQDDYTIAVTFNGGRRGVFDCTRYLSDPFWAMLKDKDFFRQVTLDHGVLTWPNGVDIAPEEVWEDSICESV